MARTARFAVRLALGLLLALAGLGSLGRQAPAAQAAPQGGGTFNVTTALDINSPDAFLSLREALLVARGGTGPNGLGGPASAGEQAALGGCTFSGGIITGGCGPGIADTIVFSSVVSTLSIITLTSSLPAITDTAGTFINGSLHTVSAAGLTVGSDALLISSDHNGILQLTIRGAPRDDVHITGSHNTLLNFTSLLGAGRHGLFIDGGSFNTLDNMLIGTPNFSTADCTLGNAQGGLLVANGAMSNTIGGHTQISCNGVYGVRFEGSSTAFNQIKLSDVLAQTGDGVQVANGAHHNTIGDLNFGGNDIAGNSHNGVFISGSGTNNNEVRGNRIGTNFSGLFALPNGQYGVRIGVSAGFNRVGSITGNAQRNIISGNGQGGVSIDSGAFQNVVESNYIGLNQSGTAAIPNGGPGVSVDNSDNDTVGGTLGGVAQYISGNLGDGVRVSSSDGTFIGPSNHIGLASDNLSPLGNGGSGILYIDAINSLIEPFMVAYNHGAGIAITGSGSTQDKIAPVQVFANFGLPIDLGLDGATLNDPGDADSGPNGLLNYPVVTAFSGSVVTGTACAFCSISIYAASNDPAGNFGGATLVQNTSVNGAGHWSVSLVSGRTRFDVTFQTCETPCSVHANTSELSPRARLNLPAILK